VAGRVARSSTTVVSWYAAKPLAPRRTILHMGLRKPRIGDEYTTGSFRDGIVMTIVILAVIAGLWLAYSWALGQPGAPAPPPPV